MVFYGYSRASLAFTSSIHPALIRTPAHIPCPPLHKIRPARFYLPNLLSPFLNFHQNCIMTSPTTLVIGASRAIGLELVKQISQDPFQQVIGMKEDII